MFPWLYTQDFTQYVDGLSGNLCINLCINLCMHDIIVQGMQIQAAQTTQRSA